MIADPVDLANRLIAQSATSMELLRIHEFADDEEAHDENAQERLATEFNGAFAAARDVLLQTFCPPVKNPVANDKCVPLCGVFRCEVWTVRGQTLYLAAAHEDRKCPLLLVLGTKVGTPTT